MRQQNSRQELDRTRGVPAYNHDIARIESILISVDEDLMARAAFECKAYARALMCYEHQINDILRKSREEDVSLMQPLYERLHEIYAHLDEPDGMEGISHRIVSPSLENKIRQHESLGRWTSAQSCWEVYLQQSPDSLESHLGLLRCLRNLGHYGMDLFIFEPLMVSP